MRKDLTASPGPVFGQNIQSEYQNIQNKGQKCEEREKALTEAPSELSLHTPKC